MKRKYRLTEEELSRVYEAAKPTPVMYLSGGIPMGDSPQEKANRIWKELGRAHGFVWDSAESAGTGDDHDLLATPIN